MRNVAERRKRPHRSGAIFRVRWSGDVSGARPRHVRLRVVSRFSALQKACQNIEMAANASVFRFRIGVVRPCGSCPAPARFLPDGRAVPASRPNGSCLAAKRFLPGRTVPAKRFLPGRREACDDEELVEEPVTARRWIY